jgi:formamidopyrimidine-DNA glycosylase
VNSALPELPELEVIAEKLSATAVGFPIKNVRVYNHIVLYEITAESFTRSLLGQSFDSFRADGKFLIGTLSGDIELVINPMLTGRIRYTERPRKSGKSDVLSLSLSSGTLWYSDVKQMSRIYLVSAEEYDNVAGFLGRGPSALDPSLTLEIFKERIRKHNGQIKSVLRNQKFLSGIGNAYADEILLYAGILPFRSRSSLSKEEIEKLYTAMRKVLIGFRQLLSKRPLNEIALEKRDFLMIHGKHNEVCPLCGNRISEVRANRFKTNYCQTCQK